MIRLAVPSVLAADAPPPRRDGVRLLVARESGLFDTRFDRLPSHLAAGDLVVVNSSGALPASVDATRADGSPVTINFAARLDDGDWVVEVRPAGKAIGPVGDLRSGERLALPMAVSLDVGEPHPSGQSRLWRSRATVDVVPYLMRVGRPIGYAYLRRPYPLSDYTTVFGWQPGSAEMPSAGRPFSTELVTDLVTRGVVIAPVLLHTGVSSPEPGEPPQAERFAVPAATARLVNATREWGGRVVAVGTTVTRALESAVDADGVVSPAQGWTDLVLAGDRPARVVTGIITGWHEPGASHIDLLEAVAGTALVEAAYEHALREQYRWHEFGDSCLFLPERQR
jgi:S-adenosylmethionine:tRNA ribosyltransferase-isomerase